MWVVRGGRVGTNDSVRNLSFKRNNKEGFESNERTKPQRGTWNEITDGLTLARRQGLSTYIRTFHFKTTGEVFRTLYKRCQERTWGNPVFWTHQRIKVEVVGVATHNQRWKRLRDRSRGVPSSLVCFSSSTISVSFSTQNPGKKISCTHPPTLDNR